MESAKRTLDEIHNNEQLNYLKKFQFEKILSNDIFTKKAVVLGTINSAECGKEEKVIIVIQKTVFSESWLAKLFDDFKTMETQFVNDIYHNFTAEFNSGNGMKGVSIYPADANVIKKYSPTTIEFYTETFATYETILMPYLLAKMLPRNKWIDNIFDGKAEAERISYRYENDSEGFLILADMKWDGKTIENVYLQAIVQDAQLLSLRQLNQNHIGLLKRIKEAAHEVMSTKYGISKNKVRLFVHYHPSFWRFHVHITAVSQSSTAPPVSYRNQLLDQVIANIEAVPDYYQKVSLVCPLFEGSEIYKLYFTL